MKAQQVPGEKVDKIERIQGEIKFMNEIVQPLTCSTDTLGFQSLIKEDKELIDPLKEIKMPKDVEQSLISLDQEVYDLTLLLEKNLQT